MKALPVKIWLQDFSLSAFVAGLLITLVGVTSSAILVFQAALAAGASPAEAASWLGSLALAVGILSLVLSLTYRAPVLIAWSTAGAAMIITGMQGLTLNQAVGAFMFSSVLIILSGITGLFEKVMNKIPVALASGLLAGVLLHFAIDSFAAFKDQPLLIGMMFLTYVVSKKFFPRMAMLAVLLIGIAVAHTLGILKLDQFQFTATPFHFTAPEFSWTAILNLGAPLFIVTMASQNLTGVTTMRTFGFTTPISPMLTWAGIANLIIAPFGGFTLNLAAITAAIGMSPEAHPQKSRRYMAGAVSGFLYIFLGLFAGVITSLFAAFPREMILAITGLALLGTIANSLQQTLANEEQREAAFICFAVTASGLTLFGIGSAFWGLVVGALTQLLLTFRFRKFDP
jgi:benzoate membrane transport protein